MEKKMNKDDMKHRAGQFAIRIIRLVESLPKEEQKMYLVNNCYVQALQ